MANQSSHHDQSHALPESHQPDTFYKARVHWLVYMRPALWMLAGLFCYSMVQVTHGPTPQNMILFFVGTGLLSISLFKLLQATLYQHTVKLHLFGDKIVAQWGVFQRKSLEQQLDKVDSIFVDQCALGKLFNAGSIEVLGRNLAAVPFRHIAKPNELSAHTERPLVTRIKPIAYPADVLAA